MKKSVHGGHLSEVTSRPLSKIRLAEILFRCSGILNSMGSPEFALFSRRYSLNVRIGFHLLKEVKKASDQDQQYTISQFRDLLNGIDLKKYSHLLEEGGLSIYDQLLQILARWRVHHWIMANQDFIVWAYRRREYLPSLLVKHAGNPILLAGDVVEQTLPMVDFMWLVELVGERIALPEGVQINRISSKISRPEYSNALLRLSAQLDQLVTVKEILSPIVDDSIQNLLKYVQQRKPFFQSLLQDDGNAVIDRIRVSNPQAGAILNAIKENRSLLVRLINLRNKQRLMQKQAAQELFQPLFDQIQQLKSLIIPLDTSEALQALQFCKTQFEFFAVLISQYNKFHPAFKSYVDANPQARDLILKLREHGLALRRLLQIQDVRAVLINPELKEYFRHLLNDIMPEFINGRLKFLAQISSINDNWLPEHQAMVWVLTVIEKYRDEFRHLVTDKKEWRSWIKSHPEFQALASEFRHGLIQCVEGPVKLSESSFAEGCMTGNVPGCVDARPGKVSAYVPIISCLLEALGDLRETDSVNVAAKDIMLFHFISNPANRGLLNFTYRNLVKVTPMMDAFQDHQNNKAEVNVPKHSPTTVLQERTNQQAVVELHSNLNVKPLKPKRLRFNFQEGRERVQEDDVNGVAVTVTLR